eukprot:2918366-Pyramimonas_sp.AAC.1
MASRAPRVPKGPPFLQEYASDTKSTARVGLATIPNHIGFPDKHGSEVWPSEVVRSPWVGASRTGGE